MVQGDCEIVYDNNMKERVTLLYEIALFIHITNAIVTIGPLFAIFVLLGRMKKVEEDAKLEGAIEGLRAMIRTVEIGGHYIVPTGLVLVLLGEWNWSTSWIVVTLIFLGACLIVLAKAFKPATKLIGTPQFTKALFIKKMYVATFVYMLIMVVLLWLMVAKPVFW